ncbi:hypothetical protein D6D27_08581 [Aureobasidium pullulans]|nr:hypothetical protein D6D27_08581 [Aureobasidium pullulans]
MKTLFTSLLLLLLIINVLLVSTTGPTREKTLVCPQVTFTPPGVSAIVDEIHHLECQRNISHENEKLDVLQRKAEQTANDFHKDFHAIVRKTLETCTHSHRGLTKPETAQMRLRLNRWVPILFDSPINLYLSAGKKFLSSLESLESKAQELATVIKQDIVGCTVTLNSLCDAPGEIKKIARAWATLASLIRQEKAVFSSTWDLVESAQKEDRMTEGWAVKVIEKSIELLNHLDSRAEKRSAGLSVARHSAVWRIGVPRL